MQAQPRQNQSGECLSLCFGSALFNSMVVANLNLLYSSILTSCKEIHTAKAFQPFKQVQKPSEDYTVYVMGRESEPRCEQQPVCLSFLLIA